MPQNYDVAIVGASLAGASAAIWLGRKGYRVALLDGAGFPRQKPCGEGLSAFGLKQLENLGLKNLILELPHLEYKGYCLLAGRTRSYLHSPWGKSITIQRLILDAAISSAAGRTPGVSLFLSQKVTDVRPRLLCTESKRISARAIILACGGNASLLKKLGCTIRRTGVSRAGVTVTFCGRFSTPPQFVHILLRKGYEIYCTPLASGRLNVSILAPSTSGLDLKAILLSAENLKTVFTAMDFSGELELPATGRTGIGNVRRTLAMPTVFLAGDAKEEFDPIGGMGMSHALRSGILTAQAVSEYLSEQKSLDESSAWYGSQSQYSLSAMRMFTGVSYRTLRVSAHVPPLLHLVASPLATRALKFFTKELA
ncbi:MAG: FAD-dependent monooxygenase [Deltaproteobacteria bacterium]|nr:FAD-dependent monooxygenase [Deltaproteobacteria bacterium]